MHAVVVSVTVHDRPAAVSEVNEQVVPRERSAPGFVANYWIALPHGKGRGTIVFDMRPRHRRLRRTLERRETQCGSTASKSAGLWRTANRMPSRLRSAG